jgi:hypothetical protein
MNSDKLTIEILPDGTLKTTSDSISGANHDNAENFLRNIATLAGGKSTRMMRSDLPRAILRKALEEHAKDGHTHNELDSHKH